MKRWTEKQQKQLDALNETRTNAQERLHDDLEAMLAKHVTWSEKGRATVANFLRNHGQDVLDTLIHHFDPSPFEAEASIPGFLAAVRSRLAVTLPPSPDVSKRDVFQPGLAVRAE